ncbi:hypothetical protein SAMN05444277_11427 [Parafilimonas terrae]|uniref:Uncharacterized protein n=1 Tax=Parafilimonas terrae TaxID=1465490 RepID=A0A1I5YTX5_9BACT|nr:hypothetical protein SAMN05444277_11427 [Parafilimonas terrae]
MLKCYNLYIATPGLRQCLQQLYATIPVNLYEQPDIKKQDHSKNIF